MKMLLSVVAVASLTLSCSDVHQHLHAMVAQDSGKPKSAATAIAGQWTMSVQTPHGPMKAGMQVKQDGTRITGTCDMDHMGSMALAGTVDGKRISFSIEIQAGQKITFSGVVDGNKMGGTTDPEGGDWTATRHMRLSIPALLCCAAVLGAQTSKTILGTVTEFKAHSFEMGIKSDGGETSFLPFSTDTQVVQIPPGERDLGKATPAAVTDILAGDRVMVSFVAGMPEARRIVLISSRDIAKRNEAEKLDWKTRGISGIAESHKGSEITVEIRTPQGAHTALVTVTEKTKIRRYAPDSVKFSDAVAGRIDEIAAGDQVRARGLKSQDGSTLLAEEVVFGTFLTRMGPITAVNRETGEIQIQEVTTKTALTIRVIAASQLKMMPDMRAMLAPRPAAAHSTPAPAPGQFDIQSTMERLPAATIDDLKVGGAVIITSTKGAKSDAVTAILLLANADFLVKMAQGQSSGGESGIDAINRLHGGMLSGPTGFSLPTMIQ